MKEKKTKRPAYSSEFRAEAVRKCLESNLNQVSKELGVSLSSLRNWVAKANTSPSTEGKPSYADLEKENRRLRKELGYVNEINGILKKSTAIFSSRELGGSK